jgi:hypothetical protein
MEFLADLRQLLLVSLFSSVEPGNAQRSPVLLTDQEEWRANYACGATGGAEGGEATGDRRW